VHSIAEKLSREAIDLPCRSISRAAGISSSLTRSNIMLDTLVMILRALVWKIQEKECGLKFERPLMSHDAHWWLCLHYGRVHLRNTVILPLRLIQIPTFLFSAQVITVFFFKGTNTKTNISIYLNGSHGCSCTSTEFSAFCRC